MPALSAKRRLPMLLAALVGCGPGAAAVDDADASTGDAESTTTAASGSGSLSPDDGTTADPPVDPSTSSGRDDGDPFGTWGEASLLAELTTPRGFAANAIVVTGPWLFAAADSFGGSTTWRVAIASGRVDSQHGGEVPLFATGSYVYPRCMALLCTRIEIETFSSEQVEDVREIVGANPDGVVLIRLIWENGPTPRRPLPSYVLSWRSDDGDATVEVVELATAGATTIAASPVGSTLAADADRVVWVDATDPTHVFAASAADLAIEEVAAAEEPIVDVALGPDALYWLQTDGAVYRVGFPE